MEYERRYSKSATKYLSTQTETMRKRLKYAIQALPEGAVKSLNGRSGYRLTVGGFRVLFHRDDDAHIIWIDDIGPRGDIYKK